MFQWNFPVSNLKAVPFRDPVDPRLDHHRWFTRKAQDATHPAVRFTLVFSLSFIKPSSIFVQTSLACLHLKEKEIESRLYPPWPRRHTLTRSTTFHCPTHQSNRNNDNHSLSSSSSNSNVDHHRQQQQRFRRRAFCPTRPRFCGAAWPGPRSPATSRT